MSFFADMLGHDGHMAFEKCGDVVVSPKDNKIALFCHFCKDLITYLPEFLRHLQVAHGDKLHFTKEHHVYSVEELLAAGDDGEEGEDEEAIEECVDSGVPLVAEEPVEREESNNTPEIDLPDKIEEETSGSTRDIMAEVEAMLLLDEEVVEDQENAHEDKTQDLAMEAYIGICQELQEKKEAAERTTKEPNNSQTEPEIQRSRGVRHRREGLKISHLRSHAIARQSRKRMSSVKKRILRAIDNFVPKKQVPETEDQEEEKTEEQNKPRRELAPIRPRQPLSKTPSKPPMNSAHLSVRKSTLTTARISLQMTTTTTSSETIVSCSNEAAEASYQAVAEEAFCQENEISHLSNIVRTQSTQKKSPIQVRKIEILPLLNLQAEKSDKAKNLDEVDIDEELASLLKNRAVGLKRKERCDPTEGSPRAKKSAPMRRDSGENKVENVGIHKIQKINQDVQKYLTVYKDTKQSKLQPASADNELDSLLARLESFKKPPASEGNQENEVLIDNCTLLKYVGLPVIHIPSYEDKIMLDELEDLRKKAAMFSEIYRKYDGIWNCRKTKPLVKDAQQLAGLIELFTNEVNDALGSSLSKNDAKRILNLITLWFWNTVDLKYFKKVPLSPSHQHYFNLFVFIPQFTRFLFFCEFCDENFTLEGAYKKHLMSHSFTIRCAICRRAFKGHGFLDKHLRAFHPNVNVLEYI